MLWIWWPGFVVPACMVLGGLGWKYIRRLPYRRKEKLSPEQLALARESFCRALWQLGLALGALTFMVMRSVRLEPAVQRALREKYGDTLPKGKEEEK